MPRYDDAQFQATRTVTGVTSVTNVATAVQSKFCLMNAAILKNVRGFVITAGTSVGLAGVGNSGAGYSIVVGTTTAGVLLTGSDTAGSSMGPAISLGNTVVPAGAMVSVLHGTETTGVFGYAIEYTEQPV